MNQQVISGLHYLVFNTYLKKLSAYNNDTSIECGIRVGRIIGNFKNCRLSLINACNNNGVKSLQLLIDSILETLSNFPEFQKKNIANELGINIDEYKAGKKTKLQTHCEAYAGLIQHVDIQDLNLGTCYSPNDKYMDVKVINTGSALSNCGVEIVLNKLLKYNKNVHIDNKISKSNFSVLWLVAYVVICVCVLLILGLIYRSVRVKYVYGVYI